MEKRRAAVAGPKRKKTAPFAGAVFAKVVDPIRIELTTSAMPLRRSSN
jgi:hypothetical protein